MSIGSAFTAAKACFRTSAAAIVASTMAVVAVAQPASSPVHILDVPYIQQSEALCGGAAAAMVMRYWGATGVRAESFSSLVDTAAGGIRGADLLADLAARGWNAQAFRGDAALVRARLNARHPVVALVEDRPGAFHFVVVVAWTSGRVVYHDPARAPFRVASEQTFETAWNRSGYWAMLLLPPAGKPVTLADPVETSAPVPTLSPCDDLVARGIQSAEAGNRAGALEVLAAAADACPHDASPLREMAGVQALTENWPEAKRLAREAVSRDPADVHAWRILATGAYLTGDSHAALSAWNAAGEPMLDLVTVQGLDRTRHAVVTSLLGLDPDAILNAGRLAAAQRRISELPSADLARVTYRPLGGGKANVEATVVERPKLPTTRASLAGIGVRLVTDREVEVSAASLTGGGELLTARWRWWANRPRIELAYDSPSAVGTWHAGVFGEEQTYGPADASIVESRRGGAVSLSQWTSTLLRWQVGATVDAWGSRGRTGGIEGHLDQRLFGDRLSIRADASALGGAFTAWTSGAGVAWRSAVRNEGVVASARAGVEVAADDAPRALWPGAGSGHARSALLRAHPLLDDGRIDGDVFGRRLFHGGAEVRRWFRPVLKIVRIAPAGFVDVARADRRIEPGSAWHVDAGVGLRVALPGSARLRVDLAKGLRDGATGFSIGLER